MPKDLAGCREFIEANQKVLTCCEELRKQNEVGNRFHRVYPDPRRAH
jgi:hypothetical protein